MVLSRVVAFPEADFDTAGLPTFYDAVALVTASLTIAVRPRYDILLAQSSRRHYYCTVSGTLPTYDMINSPHVPFLAVLNTINSTIRLFQIFRIAFVICHNAAMFPKSHRFHVFVARAPLMARSTG